MNLTDQQVKDLNLVCQEATWIGLEINQQGAWAGITLCVRSLPVEGPAPTDTRVLLVLEPLTRIAASYRDGIWNDKDAEVIPLTVPLLEHRVFEAQDTVCGTDFFNVSDEQGFEPWSKLLSLDVKTENIDFGSSNTLNLFQDLSRFLAVRIWFGGVHVYGADGKEMPLLDLVEGSKRWWQGLRDRDPRTSESDNVLLKRSEYQTNAE